MLVFFAALFIAAFKNSGIGDLLALKGAGYEAWELVEAGYTPKEIKEALRGSTPQADLRRLIIAAEMPGAEPPFR